MKRPLSQALPIVGILLFAAASGAWSAAGTEGATFLEIPVGAGPASMGSAYSALATDAYAPTWNPAGLGFVESPELATQYLSYLQSINDEYASFVYPVSPGKSLGVSAQYLGTGDIPETEVGGASAGSFSSHYGAYALAYGQTVTDKLSLGLTATLINAEISDVSANAYGVDFGALYKVLNNFMVAGTLMNLGTKLNFISEGDSLPLEFHLAGAYSLNRQWLGTVETVVPQAGSASVRVGGQWRPIDAVSLRVGYRTDTLQQLSALAGFSTGIGINLWGQEFAYAWVPLGDLGDTQYISLVFRFGEGANPPVLTKAQETRPAPPLETQPAPQVTPPVFLQQPVILPPNLEGGAPEAPR